MRNFPYERLKPNLLLFFYFLFKIAPMIVSGVAIYLGYRLFLLGVTGKASLVVDATTVGGQLVNAAPGLFFAVGGLVAIIVATVKGARVDLRPGGGKTVSRAAGSDQTTPDQR